MAKKYHAGPESDGENGANEKEWKITTHAVKVKFASTPAIRNAAQTSIRLRRTPLNNNSNRFRNLPGLKV
jgi:hypothetical protein